MSTSLVARIVGMIVSLVNVPVAVRYLGNEGYGLLTVIISVVGWIQFSNLGLGLGLQNTLTEQTALGNKKVQRELISTTFFALLGIGALLIVAAAVAFPLVRWTALFPPTTARFANEIPGAVAMAIGCFIAATIWGFIQPIYAARQELHLYSLQGLAANITSLLALFAAVHFKTGLLGVAVANIGVNALFAAGFAVWTIYGRGLTELRPSWSAIRLAAFHSVFRTGFGFLALQICSVIISQADGFLIAQFLSTEQVTPYAVGQRVFAQLIGVLGIITAPLWPAFGHAKTLGDTAWIRRIYQKVIWYSTGAYLAAFLSLCLAGHWLLALWVGKGSAPKTWLLAAIGAQYFLNLWSSNHAILLNGLGVIRQQVWAYSLQALLGLGLSICFIKKFGVIGIPLGGGLAYLVVSVWYLPWLFQRTLNKLKLEPSKTET